MTTPHPADRDEVRSAQPVVHDHLTVVVTPGAGTAIVNTPIVLVIDAPATDPLVTDLIAPVLGQAGLSGVIRQVALHQLDQVPGLVCIAAETGGIRLLVRAPLTVQLTSGSDTVTFDGEGRSTWNEVTVPSADSLRITLPSRATGAPLGQTHAAQQIEVGVVPMGSVAVSFSEATATEAEARSPMEAATHQPTLAPAGREGDAEPDQDQTGLDQTSLDQTSLDQTSDDQISQGESSQDQPPPEPADPERLAPEPAHPHDRALVHEPAAQLAPSAPVAAGDERDAQPDLDLVHLFEETTYRPAAPAPAKPGAATDQTDATTGQDEPDPEPSKPPVGGSSTTRPDYEVERVSPPTVIPAAVIPPRPAAGALISSVPGMGPAASATPPATPPNPFPSTSEEGTRTAPPSPASPTASSADDGDNDLDDVTISAAALRQMLEQRARAEDRARGTTLAAIFCPDGHPNPTHQDICRACDQAITNRAATTIDRPVLGQLVFTTGLLVDVDQHLLIGRRPPEDQKVNDEPTRAVQLDDPEHLMSRTHLQVQLDGWQVLVVDRDSMNHTFVEVPGRAAFQLRPGEPYPIPPGTMVRLGEEASFTYVARMR